MRLAVSPQGVPGQWETGYYMTILVGSWALREGLYECHVPRVLVTGALKLRISFFFVAVVLR